MYCSFLLYFDFDTGFFRSHNRFLTISKPVFTDLKTGFCRSQNRFLKISKLVFAHNKTSFCPSHNRFCRSQLRFVPISKPVFENLKTGFSDHITKTKQASYSWRDQGRPIALWRVCLIFVNTKTNSARD